MHFAAFTNSCRQFLSLLCEIHLIDVSRFFILFVLDFFGSIDRKLIFCLSFRADEILLLHFLDLISIWFIWRNSFFQNSRSLFLGVPCLGPLLKGFLSLLLFSRIFLNFLKADILNRAYKWNNLWKNYYKITGFSAGRRHWSRCVRCRGSCSIYNLYSSSSGGCFQILWLFGSWRRLVYIFDEGPPFSVARHLVVISSRDTWLFDNCG